MLRLLFIASILAATAFCFSSIGLPPDFCVNTNVAEKAASAPSLSNNVYDNNANNENFHLRLSGGGGSGAGFSGFVIQAQDPNGAPVGKFKLIEGNKSKTIACKNLDDTITHTETPQESSIDSVDFTWVPSGYQGNVRFVATVAKDGDPWTRRVLKEINV